MCAGWVGGRELLAGKFFQPMGMTFGNFEFADGKTPDGTSGSPAKGWPTELSSELPTRLRLLEKIVEDLSGWCKRGGAERPTVALHCKASGGGCQGPTLRPFWGLL